MTRGTASFRIVENGEPVDVGSFGILSVEVKHQYDRKKFSGSFREFREYCVADY